MWAGGPAMSSPGEPQAEPTIGEAINGGFDLLEAKCNRCKRVSLVPLRVLKHPPDTPVWKLEAALYCEPCSAGRHYSRRQRAHILGLTYLRPDPDSNRASISRKGAMMKFKEDRSYADPEAGMQKLLELANSMDADRAGRLNVGVLNIQFKEAGGSFPEYGAAVKAAIDRGYLIMHPSGGYVTFTQAGADLFA